MERNWEIVSFFADPLIPATTFGRNVLLLWQPNIDHVSFLTNSNKQTIEGTN